MATSRSTARRAKRAGRAKGETADEGQTTGVVGTRASAAKFRQSIDASVGVTAVLFRGERFPSFAALHKKYPEAKALGVGKRGAVVGPGSGRAELWPEMQLREDAGVAVADEDQADEQTDEDQAEEGDGYTDADLEPLSDQELVDLAEARGITVKSGKGRGRGKPKRADYLAALLGK